MTKAKEVQDRYVSQAVVRALKILTLFNDENPSLSLSDIAELLGVNRTVPYRLIYTLESLGYLRQDKNTKRYELSSKVLELGFSYLQSLQLPDIARPFLEKIRDETGLSAHLGILDDQQVVYVGRAQARGVSVFSINVGSRIPAYVTALGKVLLAYEAEEVLESTLFAEELRAFTTNTLTDEQALKQEFEQIRAQQYALSNEEFEKGIRSIAVPIFQKDGRAVAAINVACYVTQFEVEDLITEALPVLKKAAEELSIYSGYQQKR